MAEDIPYNRVFDLAPGLAEEVAPGVRRLLANNPGPFTFKGTVSYIVGRAKSPSSIPAGRSGAYRCLARDGAGRDGDAYLRHSYPPRSLARLRPRSRQRPARRTLPKAAPRGAAVHIGDAKAGGERRSHFRPDVRLKTARSSTAQAGSRRRWRRRVTRPTTWPMRWRNRIVVLRRPCHGLVDPCGCTAGRRHGRLHGLAGEARASVRRRPIFPAMAARCRMRRVSSQEIRSAIGKREKPILRRLGRGPADIPNLVARNLYRDRSATRWRGGPFGARAS